MSIISTRLHAITTKKPDQNLAILSGKDVNIFDYFITSQGTVLHRRSFEAAIIEVFSNLDDFFSIDLISSNLQSLIDRVKSLNDDEAYYDQDTRERMCSCIWRKFQRSIENNREEIDHDLTIKKSELESELKIEKEVISNLLNRILPTSINPVNLNPSNLLESVDSLIDAANKCAKNTLSVSRNTQSCANEVKESWK